MDETELAPAVGLVGCVTVVALVAAPYAVLSGESARLIATYYGVAPVGPYAAALLSVLATIAFAAGLEGRSDPALVAGTTLVVGAVTAVILLVWAMTVPVDLVFTVSPSAWLEHHRWALVVASVLEPLGAAWYARAVGVI